MKVLQICPGAYKSGVGGISEHIKNISECLARQNDVTVYATNPGGRLARAEVVNGVKVRRFARFAPGHSYFFSVNMIANLRKESYDVVHAHGYHALPMHFSSLTRRHRLILTTHFHDAGHTVLRDCFFTLFKPFGRIILTEADGIIAVSEYEKMSLCNSLKIDASRVVVIPNGVVLSEFSGLKRRSRRRSILYVGRLELYKGVQYLIEVLPLMQPDITLNIVGSGPAEEILRDYARKLGVENRVSFYSDLPRQELLQMYVDADVFALLSEHESYSIVIAEALSAGTPCVVTDASALGEWIDNDFCLGVEVPVRLKELATKLTQAIERSNPQSLKNRAGKKILDWCEVTHQIERLYRGKGC